MYSLHYSDLGGGMGDDVARPFSSLDNGMDQQNEPMMKPQQNYLQRHEELLHSDGNNQINDDSGSLSRNDDLAVVRRPPDVNIRPQMTMDKLPQINAKQLALSNTNYNKELKKLQNNPQYKKRF